jgi:hypothetical protein
VVATVLAVALVGSNEHASTTPSLNRGEAIAVSAKVTPESHLFGETIHVRVDAVVDRRRLDPDRLRLRTQWRPYQTLGPTRRTRTDVGPFARLRWDADIHCVIVDCAPQPGSAVRRTLNPSAIVYAGRPEGRTFRPVRIRWPEVNSFSRLDPIELERRAAIVSRRGQTVQVRGLLPPWKVVSSPLGSTSYRVSPTATFWGLLVVALACVLAATAFLRPWLPELGFLRKRTPPTRLEQALEAVDRARGGRPTEERKALELLAAELRRSGRGRLAWAATELAWSPSAPEPARTGALTADVRRTLEGRTNGHRP